MQDMNYETFNVAAISKAARAALAEAGATITGEPGAWLVHVAAIYLTRRPLVGWRPFGDARYYRLTTGKTLSWCRGHDAPDPPFNELDVER